MAVKGDRTSKLIEKKGILHTAEPFECSNKNMLNAPHKETVKARVSKILG